MAAVPDALASALRRGEIALLLARASGEYGEKVREAAALDAVGAVGKLATTGIDYSAAIPPKRELMEMLREATPVKSIRPDGTEFHNTFVELDLRSSHGFVLLVSAGSGKKVDDHCIQPFAQRAAELARDYRPVLTFGRRFDRWVRRAWALGPLMLQLEEQPEAFVGDGRHGIHQISAMSSFMIFFATSVGQEEADKLPVQTRDGMVRHTDTELVDGRATFGLAHSPPPGLARARLREGAGAGRSILFLDDPASRPAEREVAYGLPQVFDAAGKPVDQTKNVIFALERLGKPGWSRARIVQELSARLFSTDGLRKTHGPETSVEVAADDKNLYRFVRSILDNLDVYETGSWTCHLGVAGFEPVTVSNIWPRGMTEWVPASRIEEIRRYLMEARQLAEESVVMSFSGLRARVNGEEAVLLAATKQTGSTQPDYSYKAVRADAYPARQVAVAGRVRIPHHLLAEALVAGLGQAGDLPLEPLTPADGSDEVSRLRAELHAAKVDLERRRTEQDGIFARLHEQDAEGRLLVGEAMTRRLNERYEELESLVAAAEQRRDDLDSELREAEDTASESGQHVERLLHLVASLRDPTDLSYRQGWLSNLSDVTVDTTRVEELGHTGKRTDVSGALIIRDDTAAHSVPFSGSRLEGAIVKVEERIESAISQMRAGTPFWSADVRRLPVIMPAVAERLSCDPKTFVTGNIEDPGILRIVMLGVHSDPQLSPEMVAAALGAPTDRVERVLAVHRDPDWNRAVWRVPGAEGIASLYTTAATSEGRVSYDDVVPEYFSSSRSVAALLSQSGLGDEWQNVYSVGYELRPCGCGSVRRAPLTIPEAVGSVCLDCRRDWGGVEWPADPYDVYLAAPGMWVKAGLADPAVLSYDPATRWRPGPRPTGST